MDYKEAIKDIGLEMLQEFPIATKLQKDAELILKYQEAIVILQNNPENMDMNILRIGTSLLVNIVQKKIQGKVPSEYTNEDWKTIANNVAQYGLIMDEQRYTEEVFKIFVRYIDFSVKVNSESIREDDAKDILGLSDEIRALNVDLENGQIREADYVDRCLWISFEAMIKLLAAYKTRNLCPEYADFIKAVADISVQYGRYRLYQKELDLLNGYLSAQAVLDETLESKYNVYIDELKKESSEFDILVENAFKPDFKDMLRNSVMLAQKAGVDQDKILDSNEKIDSFFMD